MLVMDSPLTLPSSYRSPSTRRRVPRSPTASTPRDDDLTLPTLEPTLDRTNTNEFNNTDAALIVALTSLSRGVSADMKTPGNELAPPTPSSKDGDLSLTDLLRGTSASELNRNMQISASMDDLPLLTPSMGKFPSMISTCSDIAPKTPKSETINPNKESDIQVIDPLAPLEMERVESMSNDVRGITAENVQHADDDDENQEIVRAAEEIRKRVIQQQQSQQQTSRQQDDDEPNDELENQARPQQYQKILPQEGLEILPIVRTTSNPDALPDEIHALDSEESTIREEQHTNELLERPDLMHQHSMQSMNEEKKMMESPRTTLHTLDSKFALLSQHMNIANKRPAPESIPVPGKRPRVEIGMGGKTGFQPVRGWQTPVPTTPSYVSQAASGISRFGAPHFPSHILTPTQTSLPTPSMPPPLPTATNLTTLSITASRTANTTSGTTFSSTINGTPSIFAPITLHNSPPPSLLSSYSSSQPSSYSSSQPYSSTSPTSHPSHHKHDKKSKKRHHSSEEDEESQHSGSRSPSPHSLAQREAIIAQSSHAEGDYPCIECGKKFTTQTRMMIHVRTHGGAKPFVCEQCGQQFNHKGSLTRHIRTHGGEKPYECSICHKRFFQTGNLTVHFRTHTGEKPFECTECGKRFNHRSSLTVHFRNHF